MSESARQTNRLAGETSPYLLQHAHNPVDWYPWGPEALERARREDRPIFLSIGYSACHWCHVMAHESFEDPDSAALMNQLFINIKVDREERPDLDKIYQNAHQLIHGRPGCWPLTMFLSPIDQRPYFGGTYFPKVGRPGLPAFEELLQKAADYYRDQPAEIRDHGQAMVEALEQMEPAEALRAPTFHLPSFGAMGQTTVQVAAGEFAAELLDEVRELGQPVLERSAQEMRGARGYWIGIRIGEEGELVGGTSDILNGWVLGR